MATEEKNMHALIVVSHPLDTSLTHGLAHAVAEGIREENAQHSVEIADLAREGFNPSFTAADYNAFMKPPRCPLTCWLSRRGLRKPTP